MEVKNSIIVCLGDSITEGYTFMPWTETIKSSLGIPVFNAGIGGNTTLQMINRFDSDVLSKNPTHCIIECGINDCVQSYGYSLELAKSYFLQLIAKCTSNGIIPILGTINPVDSCNFDSAKVSYIDQLRAYQVSYCNSNGIQVIDFYNLFKNNIGTTTITTLLNTDYLHPNQDGHIRMGQEASRALRKSLPEFIGTTSIVDDMFLWSKTGQAPKLEYQTGAVVRIANPKVGSPLALVCTNGTDPHNALSWVAENYARSIAGGACNKVYLVDSSDTNDYYFELGDILINKEGAQLAIYKIAQAGYRGSHPVASERASFTQWARVNFS